MTDNYPETITITTPPSSATTWVSAGVEVPLLNLPGAKGNKARVIEIIKIELTPIIGLTTGMYVSIGGIDFGSAAVATYTPTIVASDIRQFMFKVMGVLGTNITATVPANIEVDFTYGSKGLLFPGPTMYVNLYSATANNVAQVVIHYRIKSVPLPEYLGIVNQYQIGNSL